MPYAATVGMKFSPLRPLLTDSELLIVYLSKYRGVWDRVEMTGQIPQEFMMKAILKMSWVLKIVKTPV